MSLGRKKVYLTGFTMWRSIFTELFKLMQNKGRFMLGNQVSNQMKNAAIITQKHTHKKWYKKEKAWPNLAHPLKHKMKCR